MRQLLQVARERSPWHRERLAGVDVDHLGNEELATLPAMTKTDLMANFDRIVTDPRLALDLMNEHISNLTADAYLFDEYHAVASGGSSGQRGVFVYDREAWRTCFLTSRGNLLAFDDPVIRQGTTVQVTAHHASHLSSVIVQTFVPVLRRLSVTMPFAQIVAGLNELQPVSLSTYPSALLALAREAQAGRLRMAPRWIMTTAEPLFPEIRQAAREAWGVEVINQ